MNVFLITSFTNFYRDARDEKRKQECKETIASVRAKVPNVYIIINEGSDCRYAEGELDADKICYTSVQGFSKSHGDHWLWYSIFSSEWFQAFLVENNVQTVTKFSSRYLLLDKFDWTKEPEEIHLAHYLPEHNLMHTFFFRFHKKYFSHVLETAGWIENGFKNGSLNHMDIEHAMYYFNVLDPTFATKQYIGVGGWCAGDNTWHER